MYSWIITISVFMLRPRVTRTYKDCSLWPVILHPLGLVAQFCDGDSIYRNTEYAMTRHYTCNIHNTYSRVPLRYSLSCCIEYYRNWSRIWIRVCTHKRHLISLPYGWAVWGLLWGFWRNGPHYKGTTLYMKNKTIYTWNSKHNRFVFSVTIMVL